MNQLIGSARLVVPPCLFRIPGTNLILFQEGVKLDADPIEFDLSRAAYVYFTKQVAKNPKTGEVTEQLMINHVRADAVGETFWGNMMWVPKHMVIVQDTQNPELIKNLRQAASRLERP